MTATSYDLKGKLTLNVLKHIKLLNFCNIEFLYVNSTFVEKKQILLVKYKPVSKACFINQLEINLGALLNYLLPVQILISISENQTCLLAMNQEPNLMN